MRESKTDPVPADFRQIFRTLVIALQPRHLEPDTVAVYWALLGHISLAHLQQSAEALARTTAFFPTTGEWIQAANALSTHPDARVAPFVAANGRLIPIETTLDDLDQDGLSVDDSNEISRRLTRAAQTALMARYGYQWPAE